MPIPCQESPVSSEAPKQDLKDIDVLCTLKIKLESQNLKQDVSKGIDHIEIKIKMPNPIQEYPAFPSKTQWKQMFFEP